MNLYCNKCRKKRRTYPKYLHPGRGMTLVTMFPTDLELDIKINNRDGQKQLCQG